MDDPASSLRAIDRFIASEREAWPLADANYSALGKTLTRRVGNVMLQFNPAREVSTGASVKASDIARRPCFLCRKNRPGCQHILATCRGYEILLNPFPIFPHHLTISHSGHLPQESDPVAMAVFCMTYPGTIAFYNGARAGASAPDHRHFQATSYHELELPACIDRMYPGSITPSAPAVYCAHGAAMFIADAADEAEALVIDRISGYDPATDSTDRGLRNVLVWRHGRNSVRIAVIPRRRHRPLSYGTGPGERLVSPGAIDMAGLIITPRRRDFDGLTSGEIAAVYAQTGFSADELADIARFM